MRSELDGHGYGKESSIVGLRTSFRVVDELGEIIQFKSRFLLGSLGSRRRRKLEIVGASFLVFSHDRQACESLLDQRAPRTSQTTMGSQSKAIVTLGFRVRTGWKQKASNSICSLPPCRPHLARQLGAKSLLYDLKIIPRSRLANNGLTCAYIRRCEDFDRKTPSNLRARHSGCLPLGLSVRSLHFT